MLKLSSIICLLLCLPAYAVFAAGQDKPDISGNPVLEGATAEKGTLWLETKWEYYKWESGESEHVFLFVPAWSLKKGLGFSLEVPYVIYDTETEGLNRGVGDLELAGTYVLMWRNYEYNDALLSVEGSVKLDNGNEEQGLGSGSREYTIMPIITRKISESFTVEGQFGYTVVSGRKENNLRNYYPYSIALYWTAAKPVHLFAEFNSNANTDKIKPDYKVAILGVAYDLSERMTMEISWSKGVTKTSPDWGLAFGLYIQFSGLD